MRNKYYILDGDNVKECDLMTWARWFETAGDAKRIARDDLDGCQVSTVFLGSDHQFRGGQPLLFETMIFGGPRDQECERYSTKAEALIGHAAIVASITHPIFSK